MAADDFFEVTRLNGPGFLDVDLPDRLFDVLEGALVRYKASRAKSIDDAFLLVLGLTHLREWIAPGYDYRKPAKYPDQQFFNAIYQLESFRLLHDVANVAKHHRNLKEIEVRSSHYRNIDDWPDVDRVTSIDDGPVADYHIEGRNLADLCQEVINFYREHWISLEDHERYGSRELRIQRVQEEAEAERSNSPPER